MSTLLSRDQWVKIPSGEFVTGLSAQQRKWISDRVRQQFNYDGLPQDQKDYLQKMLPFHQKGVETGDFREWNDVISHEFKNHSHTEYQALMERRRPATQILTVETSCMHQPEARSQHLEGFYIARYPITVGQWNAFRSGKSLQEHPAALEPGQERWAYDKATVQPEEALRFCQQLGGRLPTALEWEKAARGIQGNLYPWGNDWRAEIIQAKDMRDLAPIDVSPFGVCCTTVRGSEWVEDDPLIKKPTLTAGKQRRLGLRGHNLHDCFPSLEWFHCLVVFGGLPDGHPCAFRPVVAIENLMD